MRCVIMIKDMNCANCAKRIDDALSSTRVNYEVKLDKKVVVVDGDHDMVYTARKIISDLGFTVI